MIEESLPDFVLTDSLYREADATREGRVDGKINPLKQGDIHLRKCVPTCLKRWTASVACILLPAKTIIQPETDRCSWIEVQPTGDHICHLNSTRPRKKDKY